MRPLITGGLGVNGAVTARAMVQQGWRPVLMDNRRDLGLLRDIEDCVDIVIADICDRTALEQAVDAHGVTHIAHLAALMPEPAEADPRLAVRVGTEGTVNVLEVARTKGIRRVVFTSSKGVYGDIGGDHAPPTCKPVREDHPSRPVDVYSSVKWCCEELGRCYRESYGVEFVALRFGSIYGAGKEARHGALSLYGQLIERARDGTAWTIAQGGDQRNDAVYVGDVARSICLALDAQAPRAWTFNIGTGAACTPRDFLEAAGRLFPGHKVTLGPGPVDPGMTRPAYCVLDISAAKQHLGYAPAYDVERGVVDYVATLDRLGR
jgi:UDP-glucose 4-epimerase